MNREIMQMALDALKHHRQQTTYQFCETNAAIKALEQELAKPEQEPRKEWVGLTGTEINHIFAANVGYPERMCRAISAKLKELNT
jgi:hypothetical protein